MQERLWWQKPLRVIQTNLQILDTPKMQPEKIAREIEELGSNVLVMNVGGIYAWYQSKVPFHHINEHLPKDGDLLRDLIDACHKRNIRVVARFDFSKTDDAVFQQRPWWFVKDAQGKPRIYGKERPGNWSLLYTTCLNGGYRGSEFAVPVTREVIRAYAIDGVFLNAPHYEFCHCKTCQEKYLRKYGKALPVEAKELAADWAIDCVRECVGKIYETIKQESPDMPLILYYGAKAREDLRDRLAMADLLCTEAQDVLSRGARDIPPIWEGAMAMKAGHAVGLPTPFGIIHSCPGMDWRHTGLPPAEYRFWLSQIPANGGNIWHSLTGFPDTIADKRILSAVREVNGKIALCEGEMDGAVSAAETALLWNGGAGACSWFDALTATHVQFDLLDEMHLSVEALAKYRAAVLPAGLALTQAQQAMLCDYVRQGGALLAEGLAHGWTAEFFGMLGAKGVLEESEPLAAAYIRTRDDALLPLRGRVAYVEKEKTAQTLLTLVPPFAPLDAVGAPPERASILCPETDIPLALMHTFGNGKTLFLPFEPSMLIREYKLADHYTLLRDSVEMLLEGNPLFTMPHTNGLQAALFEKGSGYMLHLANGVGQRPLASTVTLGEVSFALRAQKGKRARATSLLEERTVLAREENGYWHFALQGLEVWDALRIDIEEAAHEES